MEPKPDQLVTCPFNLAHQVEHYRYQVHLAKCQKQYPHVRIVRCPFNNIHYVKEEELNHHVANCPERGMLDSQVYITDDDHRPPVQVHMAQQDFACSENWDDDNVETYKPQEAKKGALIYNKIKGATKSERNKFRYENSIQYSQAISQQSASDKSGDNNK